MKSFRSFIYSKSFNISISILFNIALFVYLAFFVNVVYYFAFCATVTVLFFVGLLIKNSNSKINFILLLMCSFIPLVALTLLRYSSNIRGSKRLRIKWKELTNLDTGYTEEQNNAVLETLSKKSALINKTSRYLHATLNAPVFENNSASFISSGEKYAEEVCKSLKSAKKYIFVECSRMQDCSFWRNIFQILKEKCFQGIEVKLLYDDYRSIKAFKDDKTFAK